MFFRSERLFLRPGWPEDWSDLFGRIADERITGNLAHVAWPYQAGDARNSAGRPQDARHPQFLITVPTMGAGSDDGGSELIGCIGMADWDGEVHLGYWIARERWGQGYATEAARAVLAIARTLGHRRIVAAHHADNPASNRVLHKIGFRPAAATGRGVPVLELMLEAATGGDDDGSGGQAGRTASDKASMPRAA